MDLTTKATPKEKRKKKKQKAAQHLPPRKHTRDQHFTQKVQHIQMKEKARTEETKRGEKKKQITSWT